MAWKDYFDHRSSFDGPGAGTSNPFRVRLDFDADYGRNNMARISVEMRPYQLAITQQAVRNHPTHEGPMEMIAEEVERHVSKLLRQHFESDIRREREARFRDAKTDPAMVTFKSNSYPGDGASVHDYRERAIAEHLAKANQQANEATLGVDPAWRPKTKKTATERLLDDVEKTCEKARV